MQIIVTTCVYAVALAAVIYFTRAPSRRVLGALAGGAAAGCFALGAMAVGEALGLWRNFLPSTPGMWMLYYLAIAIACSPIDLITWRVARRFGSRGLTVCVIVAGVLGPTRDRLYLATHPELGVFAKGMAPVFGDAASYVGIVAIGYAVMRLVSGPSRGSRLARQPLAA